MSVVRLGRWVPAVPLALGSLLTVGWALGGYEPVLHERFEPDPKEDLAFGVRVTSGALPAALEAKGGGILPLPDPGKPPSSSEPTYGEPRKNNPANFRIDSQTSDPGRLSYHEPFRPSIAPFKRAYVFDGVDADFELTVSDPRSRPVSFDTVPTATTDEFFADLVVELKGDDAIRIPSVGPHMRVYSAHLEPEAAFGFYVDRAENWFLRAPTSRSRARLVMHVGVDRAVFDARITASSYSSLASELPKLPANVERVATELLATVGVSRVMAPSEAVAQMVSYFRGFNEAQTRPEASRGEGLYRELVRTRKGVCRHRAYAFVVTSLGLGIPARFVHNEAHAWVEVYGGTLWHRIDLGGAASGFDFRGDTPTGKPHRPPNDPFRWPPKARTTESALPTVEQATGAESSVPPKQPSGPENVTVQEAHEARVRRAAESSSNNPPDLKVAEGKIRVTVSPKGQVTRSQAIEITGTVESSKDGCGNVRVDLSLVQDNQRFASGSAMTDASGHFVSRLVVPSDLRVGKYGLVVTSVATKSCPAATAQ